MALIDWEPLQPFGARVDLDLNGPVCEEQVEQLLELFDRYRLLLFRNQRLPYDDHLRIAGWFGPTDRGGNQPVLDPAMGKMGLGTKELAFHSDLAGSDAPLEGLSLYAIDVDEGEVSTLFIDAAATLERLPAELRDRIDGLNVLNFWSTPDNSSERERNSPNSPPDWPHAEHPLVRRHPRTGAETLFLNATHTERIVGLDVEESEALIRTLFGYLYDPEFVHEHLWRNGDLVIWDNQVLQHGRAAIPDGIKRRLQRVVIGYDVTAESLPEQFKRAYATK